ncbi:uncharacterized protein RSE6_13024 [Rhynchosporium secalis]|uniref:Ubiquitin-like domain-containing protein n=1 Tax=Rhynchosporium secalis TaxID=38038 RepID=A0A1E1MRW7_RHYSE|nr:uncharacterized protein RSE6_13024 [Rhynchosporium secalis]
MAPHMREEYPQAYQSLISSKGLEFIFSDRMAYDLDLATGTASTLFRISKEQALEEFRRFVAIKTFAINIMAKEIGPTLLMEHIWRIAVYDPIFYTDLQNALEITMPYRPKETVAEAEREKRLETMVDVYKQWFGAPPHDLPISPILRPSVGAMSILPTITMGQSDPALIKNVNSTLALEACVQARSIIASVFDQEIVNFDVEMPNGGLFHCSAYRGRIVGTFIRALSLFWYVEEHTIQLTYNGTRLWPEERLGEFGLNNGATVGLDFVAG